MKNGNKKKMKCECGNECSVNIEYPLIPMKIWHCDKCDIDFYYAENGAKVVIG